MTYRHKGKLRQFRRYLIEAAKLGRPARLVWWMRCGIRGVAFYPGKYNSVAKTNS